ncbi:MAG: hypothetical protein NTY77_15085 [Elusimicrobia bacterium]|nr:hypothetical protein [Elusimicrobiota bacterium]
MLSSLAVAACLSLPLAAQSWDAQVRDVSNAAAASSRQMKASRLKGLAVEAQAQAARLTAQYQNDPIAARLKLDRWGYGLAVKTVFERMAEPEHSGIDFGIQPGAHMGTDGTLRLTPGVGYARHSHAGYLTEAVKDMDAVAEHIDNTNYAGFVAADLRYARDILRKHLDKLKDFSPKDAEEAAWKDKAVASWTELLAKIEEACTLAEALR